MGKTAWEILEIKPNQYLTRSKRYLEAFFSPPRGR